MRARETALAGAAAVAISVILMVASSHGAPPALSAPLYVLHASPRTSFVWFPQTPRVGERVLLVSTSTGVTSPITRWARDLSGNGPLGGFVPGGPVIHTSFPTPAPHVVRLRVTTRKEHRTSTRRAFT